MDGDNNAEFAWPLTPEPFALVVGDATTPKSDADWMTAIRHMGLRPAAVDAATAGDWTAAAQWIDAPLLQLNLGSMSVIAGRGSATARDGADPRNNATSLLATSLPDDWRAEGTCWVFVPQDGAAAGDSANPTSLREFFKMMVLLIDLFDASHFFWSPARLWSDAAQVRASIAEMLVSGMPPVLHLVAFRRREQADGDAVITRGLSLFGGQELTGQLPDGWDMATMVRRMARLSLDIMLNGPVQEHRRFVGMLSGEWVDMRPDARPPDPRPPDTPQWVQVRFGQEA